jgi:hypothetical protein
MGDYFYRFEAIINNEVITVDLAGHSDATEQDHIDGLTLALYSKMRVKNPNTIISIKYLEKVEGGGNKALCITGKDLLSISLS